MAFLRVYRYARARERIFDVATRQFAVIAEFGNIEVDTVVGFVAVAEFAQFDHERYHFVDVVRCFSYYFRHENIQPPEVLEKDVGIHLCDLLGRFVLLFSRGLHFIFAVVGVACQVPTSVMFMTDFVV